MATEGILPGTAAYAAQVLRSNKIQTTNTYVGAGIDPQDANAAARSRVVAGVPAPSSNGPLLRQAAVDPTFDQTTVQSDGSTMILSARGAFYLVKLSGSYGPGVYSIDELTRQVTAVDNTGSQINRTATSSISPILLTGVEFNQTDITSQVPCLDNVKVFYTFGQNFGQVVISGEILLGPLGDINYDGVNRLIDFFWKNRVSEKRKAIAVSVANNSYFVYLTGLRIARVDPDFHIMPFVMFGTLLDISREKSAQVNTAGTVITGGTLDEPSLFEAMTSPPVTRPASNPHDEAADEFNKNISTDNDPSLNEEGNSDTDVPAGTPAANVGPAGNTTAAQTQDLLTNKPLTQADKDIAALQKAKADRRQAFLAADPSNGAAFGVAANQRTDSLAYDRDMANYEAAIRGAQAARAQEANLQAGGMVQELSLQQQQDALIYQRMASELRSAQASNSDPARTPI